MPSGCSKTINLDQTISNSFPDPLGGYMWLFLVSRVCLAETCGLETEAESSNPESLDYAYDSDSTTYASGDQFNLIFTPDPLSSFDEVSVDVMVGEDRVGFGLAIYSWHKDTQELKVIWEQAGTFSPGQSSRAWSVDPDADQLLVGLYTADEVGFQVELECLNSNLEGGGGCQTAASGTNQSSSVILVPGALLALRSRRRN